MSDSTAVTTTPPNDGGEPKADAVPATSPADATSTAPTETKAPEVPESYEFAMPDGVQLDKTAAEEFSAIAKELKLDQSTAQKVADVGAKMAQRQMEAHTKLVESWTEAVKTDKEIGGDKLAENLGVARKALEMFGTPELKDVLNMTGFGNHPEVVKAFYKIGKAISQDGFVTGSAKGPDIDPAKRLFPSMN